MNIIKMRQGKECDKWVADVTVQESADSYRSYYIEGPSQTAVIELVRMLFGKARHNKRGE